MRKFIFVVLVVIVAGFLRLNQLGSIPVSMSDDETRLTYTAYSIWKTGKDLNGNFLPLNFTISSYSFNPVPIYITAPFVGLLGLTQASARLPFAIAGIATVLLTYYLAFTMTKNQTIGLAAAFVLAVSAWHLQLSRFAYEGGIALFFYTLGTSLFLISSQKRKLIFITALVCLFFGFFSYSGFKITLIPIVAVLAWYKKGNINRNQLLGAGIMVVLAFLSLWFLGKTQGALTYGSNLFFFSDKSTIEKTVELERRASTAPEFLKRLYHNKATYVTRVFLEHYLYAFSPQYLVMDQEGSGIFSIWFRGQLYYHEAILAVIGGLYLFLKKRRELVLATALLLVASLPAGLGPEPITYTIRDSFMLPFLALFIGSGIFGLSTFIKNPNGKIAAYAAVAVLYLYFIGGYLTQYYYDWTIYGAKYYSKADQDLAHFLLREKGQKKQILVADVQPMTFLQYAFYSGLAPEHAQGVYNQYTISVDGITFTDQCIDLAKQNPKKALPPSSLVILAHRCFEGQKNTGNYQPDLTLESLQKENEWYVFQTL